MKSWDSLSFSLIFTVKVLLCNVEHCKNVKTILRIYCLMVSAKSLNIEAIRNPLIISVPNYVKSVS